MVYYKMVAFTNSIWNPVRESTSEKVELVRSTEELTVGRDGDVLTLTHLPTGRTCEVPWARVRYAQVTANYSSKVKK